MEIPESTIDSRIADRVIELLITELGGHFAGGVLAMDHQQKLESSGISTPAVRVIIPTTRDRYDDYLHEAHLILLLVTKSHSTTDTDRWITHRMLHAIKQVIFRAVDSLVVEHDSTYLFELLDLDLLRPYFFEPSRSFLASPILMKVKTQLTHHPAEISP